MKANSKVNKMEILEAFDRRDPKETVAEFCRRHDVSSPTLYTWRKQQQKSEGKRFMDVVNKATDEIHKRITAPVLSKTPPLPPPTLSALNYCPGCGTDIRAVRQCTMSGEVGVCPDASCQIDLRAIQEALRMSQED